MAELGINATTESVAAHYRGLIDGLVIDDIDSDAGEAASLDVPVLATRTLMQDLADRTRLAEEVIAFAERLAVSKSQSASASLPASARS
jgi:LPPG:FO 2-phospho-L-lactate transferase